MTKRKGTPEHWSEAVRQAAGPGAKPQAAVVAVEDTEVTLSVRVPKGLRDGLDGLRVRLNRDTKERVTVASLVARAVRDFLAKHGA